MIVVVISSGCDVVCCNFRELGCVFVSVVGQMCYTLLLVIGVIVRFFVVIEYVCINIIMLLTYDWFMV